MNMRRQRQTRSSWPLMLAAMWTAAMLWVFLVVSTAAAFSDDAEGLGSGNNDYGDGDKRLRPRGLQDKQRQLQQQSRELEQLRTPSGCHESTLTSPTSSDVRETAMGLFFSVRNDASTTHSISSFSVYLEGVDFDFTLYSMSGPYITWNPDGGIATSAIGGGIGGNGGWRAIASGTEVSAGYRGSPSFPRDEDGASLIMLDTWGRGSVDVPPNSVRSFYLQCTAFVLEVDMTGLDDQSGESVDDKVVVTKGYDGLQLLVGRVNLLATSDASDFNSALSPEVMEYLLSDFYRPARFVGKVWSELATCPPTMSPTTGAPTRTPTEAPTTERPTASPTTRRPTRTPTNKPTKVNEVTVRGNEFVLEFNFGGGRRRGEALRSDADDRQFVFGTQADGLISFCLDSSDLEYAERMLQRHIEDTYAAKLTGSVTVPSVKVDIEKYVDESNGDCTKIRFIYDHTMVFNTAGDDETTVQEIIELPLKEKSDQEEFGNKLVGGSGGEGGSEKFGSVSGVGPIAVTQTDGLSTRSPTGSPSISTEPTGMPSDMPTESPSQAPSKSLEPTLSAAPSFSPSTLPTASSSPTITARPTTSPSDIPTRSSSPSQSPSSQPSQLPSVSQSPSFSPSDPPSVVPSDTPSQVPSAAPTTTYATGYVEYSFDISFVADDKEKVMAYVAGNVTTALLGILEDPNDVLYSLALGFDLRLAREDDGSPWTWVYEADSEGGDVACDAVDENGEEAKDLICTRFVIRIYFQHLRGISDGLVRGWLLEVSDHAQGDLRAAYTGSEAVRSVQIMVLPDVQEVRDLDKICEVVEEKLRESPTIKESSYEILAVECIDFKIVYNAVARGILGDNRHSRQRLPFGGRRLGLRRTQDVLGDAQVEFKVTGQYREAHRSDEEAKEIEFAEVVEDSINRDVGKEVASTLVEREVVAMKGTDVKTAKKETETPTSSPVMKPDVGPMTETIVESKSTFASSGAGIALVITAALVAFLVAGFLFYKGIQRSKVDRDDYSWASDDFSEDYLPKTKAYADEFREEFHDEPSADETPDELPAYYMGNETNIFGSAVGTKIPNGFDKEPKEQAKREEGQEWLDEKVRLHDSMTESRVYADSRGESLERDASRERLDAFESRIMQKKNFKDDFRTGASSESRRKLEAFDARLQKKVDESQRTLSAQSSRQLDEFEARIAAKTSAGNRNEEGQHERHRGRSTSPRSSLTFEEKLSQKIAKRDANTEHRHSDGSVGSFEDRVKRKMSEGSRSRSPSPTPSRGSVSSVSSFEDRLRRKLSDSSANGGIAHSSSSRQMDDFEARIAAKNREEDNRRSTASTSTFDDRLREKVRKSSVGLKSTQRPNDSLEERIAAKGKEGEKRPRDASRASTSSYEERLMKKLSSSSLDRSRSSSPAATDFEARVAARSREGDGGKSSSTLSYEERLKRKLNSSGRSEPGGKSPLSALEARIAAKNREAEKDRSRSASPASTSSYEERLMKKLSSSSLERPSMSSPGASGESSRRLDAFEARIAAKSKEGDKGRSASPASISSYEERLTKKLNSSSLDRSRGSSPGALPSSESSRRLDDLEARIAAKTREGSRGRSPGALSSSTTSMDDLEARILAKSKAGGGDKTPRRPLSSLKGNALSSSQSKLDRFESRIQSSISGDGGKSANGRFHSALTKARAMNTLKDGPRSRSPGTLSSSTVSMDEFEARIAAKSKAGGAAGKSPGALSSSMTSMDDLEARILAKSKAGGAEKPRAPVSARRTNALSSSESQLKLERFESRIQVAGGDKSVKSRFNSALTKARVMNTLKDAGGSRSQSPGALSSSMTSLDDFEARIAAKSKAGGAEKPRGPPSRESSDLESRIAAKIKEGSRGKSPGALSSSTTSMDDLEARILAKSRAGGAERPRGPPSRESSDLESRIAAKIKEGSRSESPGALSSSMTSLDSFEARVATKSKAGGAEKPRGPPSRESSDLESRIAAKIKEGSRGKSPGALSSSMTSMDDLEARILAKSKAGGAEKPRGPASARRTNALSSSESQLKLNRFESNIQSSVAGGDGKSVNSRFHSAFAKARAMNTLKDIGHSDARTKARLQHNEELNNKLQRSPSSSSDSLQDFEERIRRKSAEANNSPASSSRVSQGSHPIDNKLRGSVTSLSSSSLQDFEERVRRKSAEADSSSSLQVSSSPQHTTDQVLRKNSKEDMDNFHARLKKKQEEGSSDSKYKKPAGGSVSSYEKRLKQKLEANATRKERTPSHTSKVAREDSAKILDDYQAKIKKKAAEGSSGSSYESRLQKKLANKSKAKDEKPSDSISVSSFEAKLQRKLEQKKRDKKK